MAWKTLAAAAHRTAMRTFAVDGGVIYRRPGFTDVIIIDAVFDDTYFSVDSDTGLEVSSKNPVIGVQTADLPIERDVRVDTLVVRGVTYYIKDVQPDGEAGTTLFLSRSPNRVGQRQ